MSSTSVSKEVLISVGQSYISKNSRETLKAVHIATAVVVVVHDPESGVGGLIHMALPDSKIIPNAAQDTPQKYVDLGLPLFLSDLNIKGLSRDSARFRIIGGAQLFNFGGGSGNILNIGTRNAITARSILVRNGITIEKTETGGNKPRTIQLDMSSGELLAFFPGEAPHLV